MTDYFGPMPQSSLNVGKVIKWVQEQTNTFYRSLSLRGTLQSSDFVSGTSGWRISTTGRAEFNEDVIIGGTNTTNAQLHIHNTLQHIAIFENDGANYPEDFFTVDANAESGRLFWSDLNGTDPTLNYGGIQINGPQHANAHDIRFTNSDQDEVLTWDDSADTWIFQPDGSSEKVAISSSGVNVNAEPAYLYKETVYYTSDNTFTKADYPGLRAIRVRLVGGGGSGGTAATTGSDQWSGGGGGGGGGYAESWILAADLDTTEAVTVGGGGSASAGADSVFDTISGEVRGVGGEEGTAGTALAGGQFVGASGADGGGGTGDLVIPGSDSGRGFNRGTATTCVGVGGDGGGSVFGGMTQGNTTANAAGSTGSSYGGGGSGGANSESQATPRAGGVGGPGIVIVEVYV